MLKPRRIIEYCRIFFDVYFTPSSKDAPVKILVNKLALNTFGKNIITNMPIIIPITGLPTIGNILPKNQAGMPKIKQSIIPGKNFFKLIITYPFAVNICFFDFTERMYFCKILLYNKLHSILPILRRDIR